jgi:hypothetical protein
MEGEPGGEDGVVTALQSFDQPGPERLASDAEPALKFGNPRFQSRNLGRLRRHQRNQLFPRRLAAQIRIRIHRILESKRDSAVEKRLVRLAPSTDRMIPKKLAPAKAGVADFSEKIMSKIKEKP